MSTEAAGHPSLAFYAAHGPMTLPGPLAQLPAVLPPAGRPLAQMVQGLLLHIFWAGRYGRQLSPDARDEVNLRWVRRQLERLVQLDPAPLSQPRPPERRLVGNCRDFSVLYCALLREQGVPARARCGFATYFTPGGWEDHWVAEYFDREAGRWVMTDAQLDELQCDALSIDFNPLDMPPGRFVPAGETWLACRQGDLDPGRLGIFDLRGLWFAQGNLVRDFLSLNKIEILPWDSWGLMSGPGQATDAGTMAILDRLAGLCSQPQDNWSELRRMMTGQPELARLPDWWPTGTAGD